MLVVNVASQCGLTPQYAELEEVYESFRERGLVVLGFPRMNSRSRSPDRTKRSAVCETKYGVKFPMYGKIVVKGEGQHPLYRELIAARPTAQQNPSGTLRKTLEKHGLAPTMTQISCGISRNSW